MPHPRTLGYCGLAGALVLALGDLLMLGAPISGAEALERSLRVMAEVPTGRLLWGGALAPLGGTLLAAAAGFVATLVHPGPLRRWTAGGFLALGVAAGTVHGLFPLLGLLARAEPHLVEAPELWTQAQAYLGMVLVLAALLGAGGALALALAVVTGRSLLPRAAVLLTPVVTVPAVVALARVLPAPVGGPVAGAAYNLGFAAFFAAALVLVRRQALS